MKYALTLIIVLWAQMAMADQNAYLAFQELVVPQAEQDDYYLKFGSEMTTQEYGLPAGIIVAKLALQFPEELENINAKTLPSTISSKEIVDGFLFTDPDIAPFFCGALKNTKAVWEMNPDDAIDMCKVETTKLLQRSLNGAVNILLVTIDADTIGDEKIVNIYFRYKGGSEYQFFSFDILHEI